MLGALFTLSCATTKAPAQEVDGDVLTREWMQASNEQRVSAIESALRGASDKRRATALNAISLLVAENGEAARRQFTPGSIRPYMLSQNEEVSRTATRAYFAVSDSDAKAEADLVAMIRRGELPLPSINYIRYLRPGGITSDAASRWLTSLAVGPISAEKYAAVHALIIHSLVGGSDTPPGSLLPHVMALIRSPEYFCDYTLVRSLEKFGRQAVQHVDELVVLRARLESEAHLPVDDRSFVLRTQYEMVASVMDETIARLQR